MPRDRREPREAPSDRRPRRAAGRGPALALEAQAGRRYDLVLVDPPYAVLDAVLPALDRHLPTLLAPDGLAVVESSARDEPELPSLANLATTAPRDARGGGGGGERRRTPPGTLFEP